MSKRVNWEESENEILVQNFHEINKYNFNDFLPNKNLRQIYSQAKYLNIDGSSRNILSISEYKPILCSYCNESYLLRDNMFYVSKKGIIHKYCKDCKNKIAIINQYKSKYGIELSFDKYFNTYDVVQWYKWTILETTPNGKYLTQIPSVFITSSNIAHIVKYVIENELKWTTKAEISKLTQPIMSKYKIEFSKTKGIKNSPFALVSLAYPELNIKEWDMVHTPNNYWNDYDNFLECVKYYYFEILNENFKQNYLYFTDKYISEIFYKLFRAKKYRYNNLSWVEIFKDIDINIPYSDKCVAYDGVVLNSIEEVSLYNFIHNKLNIKSLKSIGLKRKHKYVFKLPENSIDNSYCPDFYIERLNNLKLDVPIIIEYYGLYDEKRVDYIFENYNEKTKRKNKFYKNNNNIKFIDLYPNDLKDDFKGVSEKLASFLL